MTTTKPPHHEPSRPANDTLARRGEAGHTGGHKTQTPLPNRALSTTTETVGGLDPPDAGMPRRDREGGNPAPS